MGIGKNLETFDIDEYSGGVNYVYDLLDLEANESPDSMNVVFKDKKMWERSGSTKKFDVGSEEVYAMADFGVSAYNRYLTCHVGSDVKTILNLNGTTTTIRTDAPNSKSRFIEVKQFLIQVCSNYSALYYWDGAAESMALVSASAPSVKFGTEFQGYFLAANAETTKLRIYYEDTNTMIGGSYASYFTLPGSKDDEITGFFKINGRQYVGTKNNVFRLSFIGGVAVFEYKEVVTDIGVVSDTPNTVTTPEFGQIVIFLGQDLSMYLFDGAFVRKISKKYERPNLTTPFAMSRIDRNYFDNAFAIFDIASDAYRLFVTNKGSSTNKYCVNIDVDKFGYYPFDNMTFSSGVVAQNLVGKRTFLVGDTTGNIYQLLDGSNNDSGTPIVSYYDSPPLNKNASSVHKMRFADMFFTPVANYKLTVYDKTDFATSWSKRTSVPMYSQRDRFLGENTALATTAVLGSNQELLHHQVNIPATCNMYRIRLKKEVDDSSYMCEYSTGTITGTGGGTTLTGVDTAWESYMTSDNGYKIWIDDGDHKNELYDFTYGSSTTATISTMVSGDFSGASYVIYRNGCALCSRGWELAKMDLVYENTTVGAGRRTR